MKIDIEILPFYMRIVCFGLSISNKSKFRNGKNHESRQRKQSTKLEISWEKNHSSWVKIANPDYAIPKARLRTNLTDLLLRFFYNYFPCGNDFLLSQFRDILPQSLPSPLHAYVPPSTQTRKTWGTNKSHYSKPKRTGTGIGTEQRKIFQIATW